MSIFGFPQEMIDEERNYLEKIENDKFQNKKEMENKYSEEDVREAIRRTITYLATLAQTGKFHSGNIIEEAIINSLNKQD